MQEMWRSEGKAANSGAYLLPLSTSIGCKASPASTIPWTLSVTWDPCCVNDIDNPWTSAAKKDWLRPI